MIPKCPEIGAVPHVTVTKVSLAPVKSTGFVKGVLARVQQAFIKKASKKAVSKNVFVN